TRGRRLDQHLDVAASGDTEHAEAEPAAQIAVARVAFASLAAGRHLGSEPHLVAGRGTVDTLQNQLQIEGQLELADHDDRRIMSLEGHQIATADFALDGKAE